MAEQSTSINSNLVLKKCIVLLIALALPEVLAREESCDRGVTYWDNATGRCDSCRHICDSPAQQGISDDLCSIHCPGYKPSCPRDQYYDVNVGRCDPCGPVCMNPWTSGACQQHCPDWPNHHTTLASHTEPKRPVPPQNSTALPVQAVMYKDTSPSSVKILLFLLAGLAVVVIVIVGFIFRKSSRKMLQVKRSGPRRPKQVEDKTEASYPLNLMTTSTSVV